MTKLKFGLMLAAALAILLVGAWLINRLLITADQSVGGISGRLTDFSGDPVVNAIVALYGDFSSGNPPAAQSISNQNGDYSLSSVPPGLYSLAIFVPPPEGAPADHFLSSIDNAYAGLAYLHTFPVDEGIGQYRYNFGGLPSSPGPSADEGGAESGEEGGEALDSALPTGNEAPIVTEPGQPGNRYPFVPYLRVEPKAPVSPPPSPPKAPVSPPPSPPAENKPLSKVTIVAEPTVFLVGGQTTLTIATSQPPLACSDLRIELSDPTPLVVLPLEGGQPSGLCSAKAISRGVPVENLTLTVKSDKIIAPQFTNVTILAVEQIGALELTIKDSSTLQPIAQASIAIQGIDWGNSHLRIIETASSEGKLERIKLPPTDYLITVEANGYQPTTTRVAIFDRQVKTEELRLDRVPAGPPQINLFVSRLKNGQPVQGAMVAIYRSSDSEAAIMMDTAVPLTTAVTDPKGRVTVNIFPGTYKFKARFTPKLVSNVELKTITAGDTVNLKVHKALVKVKVKKKKGR